MFSLLLSLAVAAHLPASTDSDKKKTTFILKAL